MRPKGLVFPPLPLSGGFFEKLFPWVFGCPASPEVVAELGTWGDPLRSYSEEAGSSWGLRRLIERPFYHPEEFAVLPSL